MKIQLEEILWEITPKCNLNCTYCGSKSIINKADQLSDDELLAIASEISFNAKKVTISGGEPLTLNIELLQKIVDKLKERDVHVSVITNGTLLTNEHFSLFDVIGVSVNEEAAALSAKLKIQSEILSEENRKKIVWVTNINKLNYFDLDAIMMYAAMFKIPMQFQLTMYHDNDDKTLMIDGDAILDTRKKLLELSRKYGVKYVLADNIQEHHECSAGIKTCGVLFNGDVVPCLSERSWTAPRVQGNMLMDSLAMIWRDSFKACRFNDDFPCCRNCFKFTSEKEEDEAVSGLAEAIRHKFKQTEPKQDNPMMLYGVWPRDRMIPDEPTWKPQIMTYGVNDFNTEC